MTSKRKVLVIGWDAADWKIVNSLIDRGQMPNTASLIEKGTMGNLATLHPVLSPMLWTTIATGKRPFKHGVLGFSEPTPDGCSVQPISQWSRKTKAIWNILNQEGLKSHVIGWWPSHPVEAIDGVMVSNHYHTALGPPDQPWPLAPGMVHPEHAQAPLAELRINPNELTAEQVKFFVPRALEIDQDKDRRLASVMKTLAECSSVHSAAIWAMQNEPWDFMGVYYDAIDHFCHGFMKYHPPRRGFISERDFELYGGVVEAAYRFHDLMLGSMLRLISDDTMVIVCSDHGFHSDHLRPVQIPNEPAGPAIEHRDLGMFLIAGPGIKADHLIHGANVLDVTPTILTVFGLPVGEDMDGKPLMDAFVEVPELRSLPTWDTKPGRHARLSGEQQFDPIATKEALDQLVALGYIEKLDDDREKAVTNTVRELRYNLARSFMDAGRLADAEPLLLGLYETDPGQYRFGVNLALCYRASSKVAKLRALVERLTRERQAAADKARAELETLATDLRRRRLDAATKNTAGPEAGAMAESSGTADQGAIEFELLTDDERRKLNDLRLEARFSNFDLDFLMGWVLGAEGDHESALQHLRRAEQVERSRPGLHLQIGEAFLAMRHWDEAEEAFRKALAVDPLNPHGHLGIARAYLRDRDKAQVVVEAALKSIGLLYQNALAHYVLGLGLLRLRQYFVAADAMRTAVALNPNFVRAHRALARLYYLALGQRDKARMHVDAIREIRRRQNESEAAPGPDVRDISLLALDEDQEGGQVAFDGAPITAAKHTVPVDPAQFLTVVTGLPRSGTSMMMQMLAAGGLPILSDGKRIADDDNPRGYYELEAATRLRTARGWLNDEKGKAVKIVAQLLPFLPADLQFRVVFMERDLGEVLRSQTVMLDNLGRERTRLSDEQLQDAYRQQLRRVKLWLTRQSNVETLYVRHRDAMTDGQAVADRVNTFLGGGLNTAAMAASVNQTLYRQRAA